MEEAANLFSFCPIVGLFFLLPIGGSRWQPITPRVVIAAMEG